MEKQDFSVSPADQLEVVPQSLVEAVDPHSGQRVRWKTVLLLIAIVTQYGVQVVHVVGAGFLTTSVTATVGGSNKGTWLVSTMSIAATVLSTPVSQLADYWGRKWIIVGLGACGCIGCIVVSRANSIGMAIAGQAIAALWQGAQPLIYAVASEILPRKHRPLAQASVNAAGVSGAVFGLLVGGALTRNNPAGFRIYWYIVAGMYAAASLMLAISYNPPLRPVQRQYTTRERLARLDYIGHFFLVNGLILFSFSLTSAISVYPWRSVKIIAPLIIGTTLLIGFAVYETKYTRTGILHHGLFSRGRNFVLAELCILAEGMSFFAANNYFGFEAAVLYRQDQFHAGLYYSISWFALLVSTFVAGIYCSRTKTVRLPIVVASVCFVAFNALMASLTPSSGRKNLLGYAPFLGLGLGTALNAIVVAAQLSTPPELITIATGLMIATRSLGGTVALSIYNAIFSNQLQTELPRKIAAAVLPLGFAERNLGTLIGALLHNDEAALTGLSGASPAILQAADLAVREAYAISFRYIWVTAGAFAAIAVVASAFIVDPKCEFTAHIDAPLETAETMDLEGHNNSSRDNKKSVQRSQMSKKMNDEAYMSEAGRT